MAYRKIYCCKKWLNGELKKYQSVKPCNEVGAVPCSAPDPPKPEEPGEPGETKCPYGKVYIIPADQQCPEGYVDKGVTEESNRDCREDCRQRYAEQIRRARERRESEEERRLTDEMRRCMERCGGTQEATRRCECGTEEEEKGGGKCPYGNWFEKVEGKDCPPGYIYRHAGVTPGVDKDACVCVAWCQDQGWGPLCKTEGGDTGGEFGWSEDLQGLLSMLRDRFKLLMDYPRGLTEEERQAILNFATQGIKRGERGELQSMVDRLSRIGLAGGGFELTEAEKIKRATREAVSAIQQGVAIDEAQRRFNELMGTTGAAQGLMGTFMTSEQIPEVLSAARRRESRDAMNMLLQYLQSLMGGQSNVYWQAIMNSLMGQQGQTGGSMVDWLPWLARYLTSTGGGTNA